MPFFHNQTYVPVGTPTPTPVANEWTRAAYGNGTFVLIGGDGPVAYSTNSGQSWTMGATLTTGPYGIVYGADKFVAVGFGSTIAYSSNGVTWTNSPSTVTNLFWQDVTFGNGLYVAVASTLAGGSTNVYATSPDGITWTMRTLPESNIWQTVGFGDGLFVVIASGGRVLRSSNGISWTFSATLSSGVEKVTHGSGYFVVARRFRAISYSTDGIAWTNRTLSLGPGLYGNISFGNGIFVITGQPSVGVAPGNLTTWSNNPAGTWNVSNLPGPDGVWFPTAYGTAPTAGWIAANYYYDPPATLRNATAVSLDGQTWF